MYGVPEAAVEAFLGKFPWLKVVALRQAIRELSPPRPEDVEVARLDVALRHQPPLPFTVETARRMFDSVDVLDTMPPEVLQGLIASHRATIREAMGEEWLAALEKELPPAPGGWWRAVKRFLVGDA